MEFLPVAFGTHHPVTIFPDVRAAMAIAAGGENPGPILPRRSTLFCPTWTCHGRHGSICQDTGMPTFVIHTL